MGGELDHVGFEGVGQHDLDVIETFEIEDVLDDVIAIGVADEHVAMTSDLLNKYKPLSFGSMVETALKDAAAMAVGGNFDTALGNGVEQELILGCGEAVKTALDDMVAVEIFD